MASQNLENFEKNVQILFKNCIISQNAQKQPNENVDDCDQIKGEKYNGIQSNIKCKSGFQDVFKFSENKIITYFQEKANVIEMRLYFKISSDIQKDVKNRKKEKMVAMI